MSRIDDELEQAVRDAENQPTGGAGPGGRSVVARSAAGDEARPVVADAEERKGWGLLAVLLVLGGVVLTLTLSGGKDAVAYSYGVDEIKTKAAELGDRQLRVQGSLVRGSLLKRDNPCEHRFLIRKLGEKTGDALEVRYPMCVVPDTFRDQEGVEVTAEGRLASDGHLEASKIFAKCPSKYDPSTHEMNESAKGGQARVESSSGVR